MAYTEFFEAASRSAKSRGVRDFMAEMARRSRMHERLMAEFTEQVVANRTRREGKAPKLTRTGKEWLKEADKGAREAAKMAPRLAAQFSEEEMLRFAVDCWQDEAEFHEPSVYHADDQVFAKRIQRHIDAAARLAKDFLRRRGVALPKRESLGGGISFNAAFQRAVPGIGKLGGDCVAIEPNLAVLDQVLSAAKLTPLTDFADPDPQKLTRGKTPWFDAGGGLESVRFLLSRLPRLRKRLKERDELLEELAVMEHELAQAAARKTRFHFVMLD